MPYTAIFQQQKLKKKMIFFNIFNIFAQNIDCGYTLEPPRRGDSNEYTQSCFRAKIRNIGMSLHTLPVFIFIARTCFPDVQRCLRSIVFFEQIVFIGYRIGTSRFHRKQERVSHSIENSLQ